MKKIKYLILMFGVFFAIPNIVNATEYYECTVTNTAKLQRLASNIVTSYDYIETQNQNDQYKSLSFTVKFNNLNGNLYMINEETGTRYNYSSDELVISNLAPSQALHFKVYANAYACNDKYLITIYINLPAYNKYYIDPICDSHQNHKLCNKWTKTDLTYDKFIQAVSKYDKKTEIIEEPKKQVNSFQKMFADAINYLDKNKLPIFGSIIIICFIWIIYLMIVKKQKELKLK